MDRIGPTHDYLALRSGGRCPVPGPWSGGPAIRAYRDVFTACPGTGHRAADRTFCDSKAQ